MGRLQDLKGRGNEPQMSSICSKQLLHLDQGGEPLWFNGGLYAFAEELVGHKTSLPLEFEKYIVESSLPGRLTTWEQHKHLMYWCITSDSSASNFSKADRNTLEFLKLSATGLNMFH